MSADGLPTWQINGVAWSQVIVGNTVYVAGSFTKARPPGSPVGTNEVTRNNLLAYNLTTGNLITTFHPSLNAQALVVAASPDGSRIYVGGDFTTIDLQAHSHVAAFSTAGPVPGALIPTFTASVSSRVASIVATVAIATRPPTVYVGGSFGNSRGVTRHNAAAFSVATGGLLAWNPNAGAAVNAMTLSPDKSRLVLGGHFTTLGLLSRVGLGAVDPTSGSTLSWSSTPLVHDSGVDSGVTSLSADGTNVYGTGYNFALSGGTGNFEGRFALNATTGKNVWLDDCHGDSYSAVPIGGVLYSVGHSHNCATVGAFPETTVRSYHRAIADTIGATGTLKANTQAGFANFQGTPSPTQLDWYPDFAVGTFTGMFQGGWTVTGNSSYIVVGGEFPTVNKVKQQGLVRFAVATIAPKKIGPKTSTALTPTASKPTSTTVKLTWGTTWDPDNGILRYSVLRDGGTTPIGSVSADSRFWKVPGPTQTFTDTSAPTGSHTYRIQVSDTADTAGNTVTSSASNTVTV